MLSIEIAGHTIVYRNAPDLNEKARALIKGLREKAQSLEKHSKSLRDQERTLSRFLGERTTIKSAQSLGLAQNEKEESLNA